MADGIQVTPDALREKGSAIAEIDVTLDSQAGSKSAGKRAHRNAIVAEANTDFVSSVISTLNDKFPDQTERFAAYFALSDALDEAFGKEADAFLEDLVNSSQATDAEKLSDEEISALEEQRKTLVNEFKALKNILEMFGQDVSDVPDPKIRRGSRGPRGPRTLSKFQYRVNETDLEDDVNSLSTVAKLAGLDGGVKELKSIITDAGVDLKNPPTEWDVEVNELVHLYASVMPQYEADFENGDDESDDDE